MVIIMKRRMKFHIVLPAAVLLLALVIFGGWYLLPSHPLSVAVLDKTVTSVSDTGSKVVSYRKHYGLFWMLNQLKYTNPKNGDSYNYTKDYYGTLLDDNDQLQSKPMSKLDSTPDLVYLSDTYGTGDSDGSGPSDSSGLDYEDIAAASTAHENGSTLIAESDVFGSSTGDSVKKEVESQFGVTYTGWTGRYIADMSDLTDVPSWAQNLYESQYGTKWNYTGAGILLVSDDGQLVVLEQGKDFNQSMLTISIDGDYTKEFGRHSLNYYNWFVITKASYNTQTIANFNLDLNDSGKQKFSQVSDSTTFPAVIRTQDSKAPAYFFSGDFDDYVANARYSRFLFSNILYQFFSYDRAGDITNFYWNFYYPMMSTILKETDKNGHNVVQPVTNNTSQFRISGGSFQTLDGNDWKPFVIKGFDINAVMPGSQAYEYTRDISVYRQFLSQISAMGGNCVRVYDLLPPEFYRALYEYNLDNPDHPMYFLQSIASPDSLSGSDALGEQPQEEQRKNAEYVIDAVHGSATVPKVGSREGGTYIQDVSAYLIGYLVETDTDAQTVQKLNAGNAGYTYKGDYVSSDGGSAAEGLIAMLCDHVYAYQQQTYGYVSPVGAEGNAALVSSVSWASGSGPSLNIGHLTASDQTGGSFFASFSLQPTDAALLNNTAAFSSYTDSGGSFPYGGYIKEFLKSRQQYPILIDRFGLSTNTNAFEKETSVNGLSETEQGNGIARMLKAIQAEGYLGGLISDYDDSWINCSGALSPYVQPLKDNALWQNTLDPTQTDGVTAVEPAMPADIGMSVKDNDRMQEMQLSANPSYLYISVMLYGTIDYDNEQMIIGLDTYQRNNGEYRYDPSYLATSLSGMEYVIKFESKNTAAIYVIPSYDREKGGYSSQESYTGNFDYICQLNYGTFDTSGTNFYQAGSTIHLRIPWSLLNFTDPSKKIVLSDSRPAAEIAADKSGLQTTTTDGILCSLLIADKQTKDTLYIFPKTKEDSGYKVFKWDNWSKVDYVFRQKAGCKILANFFSAIG